MLVRGDEDLLSAGTHSEKCHFVEGVDVTNHASCLHGQIGHVISDVLFCGVGVDEALCLCVMILPCSLTISSVPTPWWLLILLIRSSKSAILNFLLQL